MAVFDTRPRHTASQEELFQILRAEPFTTGGLVSAMSVLEFGVALGHYTDEFMEEEDHEISTFLPPCAGKLWHHSLPPTIPAARKPQL
ncbi:hypothetical protein PVK06_026896 [Gossypium arboreum]|uniref:Uncharacterized protein n=1 Tax=Gossypium arboreum TaxID=29729 RepID=A0ABR0NZE1_GOSAR|nr:hypothetical protein PVK06_026896 [Gossypium arboreum]